MYESHFGLAAAPFENTPNPRFFFSSQCHREALAALLYGVEQGKGIMLVTGEVGTGKTMLLSSLKERLPDNCQQIEVSTPWISATELFAQLAKQLELTPAKGITDVELLAVIRERLEALHEQGRKVVLVIDEAQQLTEHTLEGVRQLTNMESHTDKLIQLVLLGQTELAEILARHSMRPLRQRIALSRELKSLNQEDTRNYIGHRLAVGGGSLSIFTDEALRLVNQYSRGVPRVINLICDNALITAYAAGAQQVSAVIVNEVVAEMPMALPAVAHMPKAAVTNAFNSGVAAATATVAAAATAANVGSEPPAVLAGASLAQPRTISVQAAVLGAVGLVAVAVVATTWLISSQKSASLSSALAASGSVMSSPVAAASGAMSGEVAPSVSTGAAAMDPNAVTQRSDNRQPDYRRDYGADDRLSYGVPAQQRYDGNNYYAQSPEMADGQRGSGAVATGRDAEYNNYRQDTQSRAVAQEVPSRPMVQQEMPRVVDRIPFPFNGYDQTTGARTLVEAGQSASTLAHGNYQVWNDTVEDILLSANPQLSRLDNVAAGTSLWLPEISKSALVIQGRDGSWYVYFASFHDQSDVQEQVATFDRLHEQSQVITSDRGKVFYRLYLGGFASRAAAEDKAASLWYRFLPLLN